MSLWRTLKKPAGGPYRLSRLVDSRRLEAGGRGGAHVVCDIDKTYLETEFESVLRMARIAFEGPGDKVTVTGASEVLLLARWGDPDAPLPQDAAGTVPRALHFVSSSPPQLRAVLEEKLTMDGLDWSSDTFKNQAYNIRMGRMDLLRQHVAYKSQAILNLVAEAGPGSQFLMIGDNAESDAYIYTGLKLLLEGRLGSAGYQAYLETAGVEPDVAREVTKEYQAARAGEHGVRVAAVLLRDVPGYTFVTEPPLTDAVQTFDNFFEAALLLMAHGLIPAACLWALTRSFHNHHGMTRRQLAAMLRAPAVAARLAAGKGGGSDRGLAGSPALRPLVEACDKSLSRLLEGATLRSPLAASDALVQSLTTDPAAHLALDEAGILRHARRWMERLHAQKAK